MERLYGAGTAILCGAILSFFIYEGRFPVIWTIVLSVAGLTGLIQSITGYDMLSDKKETLKGGDDVESRVSMTVKDAKGQKFHIKVIPPGTVLDAGYTQKLNRYLNNLKQMCSNEGLTFTKAALFTLAPGVAITPEFLALLIKHGLSPETNLMSGPPA